MKSAGSTKDPSLHGIHQKAGVPAYPADAIKAIPFALYLNQPGIPVPHVLPPF